MVLLYFKIEGILEIGLLLFDIIVYCSIFCRYNRLITKRITKMYVKKHKVSKKRERKEIAKLSKLKSGVHNLFGNKKTRSKSPTSNEGSKSKSKSSSDDSSNTGTNSSNKSSDSDSKRLKWKEKAKLQLTKVITMSRSGKAAPNNAANNAPTAGTLSHTNRIVASASLSEIAAPSVAAASDNNNCNNNNNNNNNNGNINNVSKQAQETTGHNYKQPTANENEMKLQSEELNRATVDSNQTISMDEDQAIEISSNNNNNNNNNNNEQKELQNEETKRNGINQIIEEKTATNGSNAAQVKSNNYSSSSSPERENCVGQYTTDASTELQAGSSTPVPFETITLDANVSNQMESVYVPTSNASIAADRASTPENVNYNSSSNNYLSTPKGEHTSTRTKTQTSKQSGSTSSGTGNTSDESVSSEARNKIQKKISLIYAGLLRQFWMTAVKFVLCLFLCFFFGFFACILNFYK